MIATGEGTRRGPKPDCKSEVRENESPDEGGENLDSDDDHKNVP